MITLLATTARYTPPTLYDRRMSRDPRSVPLIENTAAFSQFVDERRGALLGFLVKLGVASEDAKDLVQEALLRLLRYQDTAKPEEWTPLAYRIVLNLHRDKQRQAATQAGAGTINTDEQLAALPSLDESPERQLSNQQQLTLVRTAILQLPPRCKEIYLLNRIDGMSYPAIAQRCGITVKAVEKNISRALRELRMKVDRSLPSREDS